MLFLVWPFCFHIHFSLSEPGASQQWTLKPPFFNSFLVSHSIGPVKLKKNKMTPITFRKSAFWLGYMMARLVRIHWLPPARHESCAFLPPFACFGFEDFFLSIPLADFFADELAAPRLPAWKPCTKAFFFAAWHDPSSPSSSLFFRRLSARTFGKPVNNSCLEMEPSPLVSNEVNSSASSSVA